MKVCPHCKAALIDCGKGRHCNNCGCCFDSETKNPRVGTSVCLSQDARISQLDNGEMQGSLRAANEELAGAQALLLQRDERIAELEDALVDAAQTATAGLIEAIESALARDSDIVEILAGFKASE